MAEYNRFVSYMYVYENNQKTMNNGFVRVETRDGRCFIYIHMKDLYSNPQTPLTVYMVRRQSQSLLGIALGDLERKNSQAEFYHETSAEDIENSGMPLAEMAGIIVAGQQGQKYGTCWDDDLLDMHGFKVLDDEMEKTDSQTYTEDVKPHEMIEVPAGEITVLPSKQADEDEMEDQLEDESEDGLKDTVLTGEKMQQTEVSETEIKKADSIFRKLMIQGEAMQPCENNDMESCIRIDLQDIGMLPMKFWMYASNCFLLNNYYNYRHLMFGRRKNGEYILGVPGMEKEKDGFMARRFGFPEFWPFAAADENMRNFGYWCVVLK